MKEESTYGWQMKFYIGIEASETAVIYPADLCLAILIVSQFLQDCGCKFGWRFVFAEQAN